MSRETVDLLGIRRLSLVVADLGAAVAGWAGAVGLEAQACQADAALLPLGREELELRAAPADGSVAAGTVEVHVAVADPRAAAARLAEEGVRTTPRDDGVAVHPADLNGVRLVLAPGWATQDPPGPRGVSHLVVAVRDADPAVARWRQLFGGGPAGTSAERSHHIPVGPAWFGVTGAGTDAAAVGRFVHRRGEGIYAVGLLVDDVDARARVVAAAGGRLVRTASGQVFVHPATTHGPLVELVAAGRG